MASLVWLAERFLLSDVNVLSGVTQMQICPRAPEPRRNSMMLKSMLAAATAVAAIAISTASAQPYGPPQGRDQNGSYSQGNPNAYYSQTDQNGYYDRNGQYQRMRGRSDQRDNYGRGPGGNSGAYYQQGAYEQNCHRGNVAAGTIFGALAGG
ncbi:MAG TPA: hypothetical protein VII48_09565, partial [Rhizomicrobium sp.]